MVMVMCFLHCGVVMLMVVVGWMRMVMSLSKEGEGEEGKEG